MVNGLVALVFTSVNNCTTVHLTRAESSRFVSLNSLRRFWQAMRRERGVGERQVVASRINQARHAVIVDGEGIPRQIRRHQLSALNVPLLWAVP